VREAITISPCAS